MTPTVFIQFLSKFLATPDLMVFFHLRPLSTPSVPPESRYTVTRTAIPNCYRLIIRHGYTDEIVTDDLSLLVLEQLRDFIIREGVSLGPQPVDKAPDTASSTQSSDEGREDTVAARLADVQRAYETQVMYIMGKEQMRIKRRTGIGRRVVLNAFLWLRDNTRGKMASMKINPDQLVEVGFVKDV